MMEGDSGVDTIVIGEIGEVHRLTLVRVTVRVSMSMMISIDG